MVIIMKSMNIFKKFAIVLLVAISASTLLTACGALSYMDEDEATQWGYLNGRALRGIIDN